MTSTLFWIGIASFVIPCVQRTALAVSVKKQHESSGQEPSGLNPCNINSEVKTNSVSDLLKCIENLAEDSKSASFAFPKDQETQGRQRPGSYGFANGGLGGALYRPGRPKDPPQYPFGSGLYGSEGYAESSDLGLADALTSISQYDDLKCVPRLLCEIAGGSKPGGGNYKASSLGSFGMNTVLGLLTGYNFEEASPLLGFAKAALLGYSSKGDPSVCYEEYVRCPKNPRALVHYLNNHNGGFFRFFKNTRHSNVAQSSNGIGYARTRPALPPGLSGPESDRTGTGKLKFDNPDPLLRQDETERILHPFHEYSKVVFPEDEKSGTRVSKSLQSNPSSAFFPATSKDQSFFFPLRDDDESLEDNNIVAFESDEDLQGLRNYNSYSKYENRLPSDQVKGPQSIVIFPNDRDERRVRFVGSEFSNNPSSYDRRADISERSYSSDDRTSTSATQAPLQEAKKNRELSSNNHQSHSV
ncbi:uncharacterized protein LOC124182829 isoform X1 [Neodiprion fabricii]|uniref:uncharacterized protein LOC124182829 isoform X1 n=1 Tax=Neodiprion fabricii TaxID=2872261 RepID=UPI001ED96AF3|nr:uncharacterized protein LOC124182829 isoform X1 [Neodiprion fabricii]